mgnify:CR=1 FL=1
MGRLKDWWFEQMELEEREGQDEEYEDVFLDEILVADSLHCREIRLHHFNMLKTNNITDHEREWRYERRGDEYRLRMWFEGREHSERGLVEATPPWLKQVISVGRVANRVHQINEPPPDEILWFRTDKDNNLTSFVELK